MNGRVLAGLAVAVPIVMATAGSLWPPFDPQALDLDRVLAPASGGHWLGTDHLGRDLASRLLAGAAPSLTAVTVALAATLGLGVGIGSAIALGGRLTRQVARRLAELALAVPTLVVALAIAAVVGPGPVTAALALAATTWAPYALVVAGLVERLMAEPYWKAAQALGVTRAAGMRRHLLPNLASPLGALAGADAGRAVVLVASLGFLGLSGDTGRPEWGAMIHEYRLFLFDTPRLVLAPVAAIALLSLTLHLGIERVTGASSA